jgi:hypothetical protein
VVEGGNRAPAPVRVSVTVVDTADQTRVRATTVLEAAQFASRAADYTYLLPTSTLAPGQYLLTIDATLGSTSVRRSARFTVQ